MKYVMLLRGMGPGDPVFNNQTIVRCLESLGYSNVSALQASGNYLFETDQTDNPALELAIEACIEQAIGFRRAAIVRSADQIAELMRQDPFKGMVHSNGSYLLVTYMKQPQKPHFELPYQPDGKPYTIVGVNNDMLFSVTDNTTGKATDLMVWLERQFSKGITSRTWNTMQRINQRMVGL